MTDKELYLTIHLAVYEPGLSSISLWLDVYAFLGDKLKVPEERLNDLTEGYLEWARGLPGFRVMEETL